MTNYRIDDLGEMLSQLRAGAGLDVPRSSGMSECNLMKHGALSVTRRINAPRELVDEAWTRLEAIA